MWVLRGLGLFCAIGKHKSLFTFPDWNIHSWSIGWFSVWYRCTCLDVRRLTMRRASEWLRGLAVAVAVGYRWLDGMHRRLQLHNERPPDIQCEVCCRSVQRDGGGLYALTLGRQFISVSLLQHEHAKENQKNLRILKSRPRPVEESDCVPVAAHLTSFTDYLYNLLCLYTIARIIKVTNYALWWFYAVCHLH